MGASEATYLNGSPQITSRSNPKVKLVRALRLRKNREQFHAFVVEGIRHVGEAIEANAQVEFILYSLEILTSAFATKLLKAQSASGVSCLLVSQEVFEYLAEKEHPQGLLAVIQQSNASLEKLNPHNFPWGVALIDPQDPGNLGTVLRTIDAVGASGLLILSSDQPDAGTVDPYHPTAVRASMGTIFWQPHVVASYGQFLVWANQHGYNIYGTSAKDADDYRKIKSYEMPSILLIGSERTGLTPEQRQHCLQLISLPMKGKATSLNLAVATGILLYDMLEKRDPEGANPIAR